MNQFKFRIKYGTSLGETPAYESPQAHDLVREPSIFVSKLTMIQLRKNLSSRHVLFKRMMVQKNEYKRPESVLVVIFAQDQVLLLQRRDDPAFWQSVTGSMRFDEENPLQSAWRELAEETGLLSTQGEMQDCHHQTWFDIYPHWRFRYSPDVTKNLEHVFCFRMEKPVNIKLSKEHLDYCWVTKEEAVKLVFSTTNREAILQFVV